MNSSDTIDVPGVEPHELLRSAAMRRVGQLAGESGLFAVHHEHRVQLELPAEWIPEGRADLHKPATWAGGVLLERRASAARHDFLPASYNPTLRAKWTGHELCHGLVGFAWRHDATPYFHALAARLAEVLPVAMWYFFDEAGLRRCPQHAGGGPLFNSLCPACEEAARDPGRAADPDAARWYEEGVAFVEAELDAVARSRRLGRPVHHRYATIDLCAEGLSYVSNHIQRLKSPEFASFAERFFPPGAGLHPSLDALEERVREVMRGIVEGTPVRPHAGGRERLVAQDVAWRLMTIRAQSSGAVLGALDALIEHLADVPDDVAQIIAGYQELHREFKVPAPEDVFAVGYSLTADYGRSVRQVAVGIASACPASWQLLGERGFQVAASFVSHDSPVRRPIGRRFAAFLAGDERAALSALTRYEAAVTHAEGPDPAAVTLGMLGRRTDLLRLAEGLELIRADYDVVELATSLRAGQPSVPERRPTNLVVTRTASGEVFVADLSPEAARAIEALGEAPQSISALRLSADEVQTLAHFGLVVPVAWDAD